jgi:hypothetical protein
MTRMSFQFHLRLGLPFTQVFPANDINIAKCQHFINIGSTTFCTLSPTGKPIQAYRHIPTVPYV